MSQKGIEVKREGDRVVVAIERTTDYSSTIDYLHFSSEEAELLQQELTFALNKGYYTQVLENV